MKTAIVFCADQEFKIGLESTIKTLSDNLIYANYDSFLITDDFFDCDKVKKIIKVDVKKYEKIKAPNPRFIKSFYKFEIFSNYFLNNYDRVLFFDADLLFMGNIDYLFSKKLNKHAIWMAKDDGLGLSKKEDKFYRVNTGVIVYNCNQINKNMTKDLIKYAINNKSVDDSDQGIINDFIRDYNLDLHYLPIEYNCLKRIYVMHKQIWKKINKNIRILHFVGNKPWNLNINNIEPEYKPLTTLWRKKVNE